MAKSSKLVASPVSSLLAPGIGKGRAASARGECATRGAATYAVTQESFDAAFEAGRAYAGAYHAAAAALQPILAPLSGLRTESAVAQWREIQRAFTLGMAEEREIDPDSARKAFNRITDYLGLDKPQTAAAAAKQAKRKAAAPAGGASEADDSPKAGEADAAVARVAMELSSMEAHIINLLRTGKVSMATQAIADAYAQ